MLVENLLKKSKKVYTVIDLKCSDEQKNMIKEKPYLLNKAISAQRLYDRASFLIIFCLPLILLLTFMVNENRIKLALTIVTAILIPSIFLILNRSFELMKEIDSATIYNETKETNS